MFADGDDNQGIVLGVVFGVIALVIGLVISLGIYQVRLTQRAAPVALVLPPAGDRFLVGPAMTGPGVAAAAASGVAVEIAAVKIYFEPGQTVLPAGATEALVSLAQEVVAGRSLSIGAWHDPVGDATRNADIAQQRMLNVQMMLASLGVPPQRIELLRPQPVIGAARDDVRERRVDVRIN